MSNITQTADARIETTPVEFENSDQHVKVWAMQVNDGDPSDPLQLVQVYLEDLGSVNWVPTTIISGTFGFEPDAARRIGAALIEHADMLDGGASR